MNETKLICFDLDDTLIDDNWKFETTFCDCIKAILLALAAKAPQIDEILSTARELDNELLVTLPKQERFTPKRLVMVWKETYKRMSEKSDIPVKEHIMQMLESYVIQNYEPPYFVIAGAVESLIDIKKLPGVRLEIVTVGDTEIQKKKTTLSRLGHYFDHIETVFDIDEKYTYLDLKAQEYGKGNVYMVGNSIRSDINPALKAGVHAIYIPRGSWHINNVDFLNNNYTELRRISDIGEYFQKELSEPESV